MDRTVAGDPNRPYGGLQELYDACYARLVAVAAAIHGSRRDAEEAVQEAFVRLIGRWPKVGAYDDPQACLYLEHGRVATASRF